MNDIQSSDDYDAGQGEYEETQDLIREISEEDAERAFQDKMRAAGFKTKSEWAAEGRTVKSAARISAPVVNGEPVFSESSTYGEPDHTIMEVN